ncbi:hypothetical protein Tco_1227430 [Tanacetum coccineum]
MLLLNASLKKLGDLRPKPCKYSSTDVISGKTKLTSLMNFVEEYAPILLGFLVMIFSSVDLDDCDPEEDIYVLKQLLNDGPFQLPPMDLKQSEVTEAKSSIEEPPELELKDLPSHLEYAYLEENEKLPVIIAKGLFIAFDTFKMKLTELVLSCPLIGTLPFELMCDASDFAIGAVLGQLRRSIFNQFILLCVHGHEALELLKCFLSLKTHRGHQ